MSRTVGLWLREGQGMVHPFLEVLIELLLSPLQIWLVDPLPLHLFLMIGYTASPLHML